MIFGDFAAAFPSLFHSWIHAVFAQLGFPDGFLDFLQALLFHNFALGQSNGKNIFLVFDFGRDHPGLPQQWPRFCCCHPPLL